MSEDKYFKEIAFKVDDIDELNESIYNQFAKDMAKLIDIDFAKTPVVDLFTGYQRGLILQKRIDKAIEYIESNVKEHMHDDYDYTYYYSLNQNECDELLEILRGKE